MRRHRWWRSSGTTETCETCGTIRYSEDIRGRAVSVERGEQYAYARNGRRSDWHKSIRTEPPCAPVDEVRP